MQFFVFTFVIVFQPFKALNKLKSSFNITGEMKAQRIQAQFIKKREIEHAKILQTNGKQKKKKKINSVGKETNIRFCLQLFRSITTNGAGSHRGMSIGRLLSIITRRRRN